MTSPTPATRASALADRTAESYTLAVQSEGLPTHEADMKVYAGDFAAYTLARIAAELSAAGYVSAARAVDGKVEVLEALRRGA